LSSAVVSNQSRGFVLSLAVIVSLSTTSLCSHNSILLAIFYSVVEGHEGFANLQEEILSRGFIGKEQRE